jgi:hypothetical protein
MPSTAIEEILAERERERERERAIHLYDRREKLRNVLGVPTHA